MAPKMWIFLAANVLTQYVCIKSVFVLTTECTSLAVTLVVTLRKFVSLLFSIVYFSNPFTFYHWVGTALVFSGTFLFVEVIPQLYAALGGARAPRKDLSGGDTARVVTSEQNNSAISNGHKNVKKTQ